MRQMQVREFLRGGYKTLREPTIVSSHNRILFTVLPHGTTLRDLPSPPREVAAASSETGGR